MGTDDFPVVPTRIRKVSEEISRLGQRSWRITSKLMLIESMIVTAAIALGSGVNLAADRSLRTSLSVGTECGPLSLIMLIV